MAADQRFRSALDAVAGAFDDRERIAAFDAIVARAREAVQELIQTLDSY